jgi:Flp pilus assembly protein TadD
MAHLDLGIVYADTGRQDDALRELKQAEQMAPEDVNVHWRLGRLYRSMGRKDEAKVELDKASSITKATDSALVDKISGPAARGNPPHQPAVPEK